MKTIPFWKMSGSGNDFVVVDNRQKVIKGSLSAWARRLCHRQFGVGADGLLLLEPSHEAAFRMVYFNGDGSRATMCGNGARCMAWVAHEKGVAGNAFQFLTDAGLVGANVNGQTVEVTLSDAHSYKPVFPVRVGKKTYKVSFINTGVPHAVVHVADVDHVNVDEQGRLLRFHKVFGVGGTNVNFTQRLDEHTLKVRTYERGVEGETLACGTGVAASAITAALQGIVKPVVRALTAGGDKLTVRFDWPAGQASQAITHVRLKGPVALTFKGEFSY